MKSKKEIMAECPEDFQESLSYYLDGFEYEIGIIESILTDDIQGIGDLHLLETVLGKLRGISNKLW